MSSIQMSSIQMSSIVSIFMNDHDGMSIIVVVID